MTIPELVRQYTTLAQIFIMQRADTRFFPHGRYYGGQLTDADIEYLLPVELKRDKP